MHLKERHLEVLSYAFICSHLQVIRAHFLANNYSSVSLCNKRLTKTNILLLYYYYYLLINFFVPSSTCLYTHKYRYNNNSILWTLIQYEGLDRFQAFPPI